MSTRISEMTLEEFREVIHDTVREAIEDVVEDMTALSSPEFLESIRQARKDHREGRTRSLDEFLKDG